MSTTTLATDASASHREPARALRRYEVLCARNDRRFAAEVWNAIGDRLAIASLLVSPFARQKYLDRSQDCAARAERALSAAANQFHLPPCCPTEQHDAAIERGEFSTWLNPKTYLAPESDESNVMVPHEMRRCPACGGSRSVAVEVAS